MNIYNIISKFQIDRLKGLIARLENQYIDFPFNEYLTRFLKIINISYISKMCIEQSFLKNFFRIHNKN